MNKIPLYLEKDFKGIVLIHYMLGSACNMKCRHCVQDGAKSVSVNCVSEMSDKVFCLVNNYIEYSIKFGNSKSPNSLMFWGGEPLVYWNQIKKITLQIAKKWDLSHIDKFQFSIFTNGKLLDKDKIDFLKKYNFMIYFSYDAPYPWAVRDYVSDAICKVIDEFPSCKVISNACSHNVDVFLARRCLKAKFPHVRKFGLGAYGFHANRTFVIPEDIYQYNWNATRVALQRTRIAIQLKDKDAWDVMHSSIFRFLNESFHKDFPEEWEPGCIMGKVIFAVTPDGKIPVCHNTNKWIGTVDDSLDIIYKKAKEYVETIKNPHCKDCQHVDVCHGICPEELRTDDGNSVICRDFRDKFYPILKEEFLKLNSPLTEEDKNWYQEQEKIMERQVQEFLKEGQRFKVEHTRFPKNYYIGKDYSL